MTPGSPCIQVDESNWEASARRALDWITLRHFDETALYDVAGQLVSVSESPPGPRRAVVSFPRETGERAFDKAVVLPCRSFVYDDAVAAVAMMVWDRRSDAEALLNTLAALQRDDGAIGFSFNACSDGFYDRDYVRTGVVAWVGYAFAYHAWRFGDDRYLSQARAVAKWLRAQRIDEPPPSYRRGLFRGGVGRWNEDGTSFDPTFVLSDAVTEHQVDAWFFLQALAATGDASARADADQLARNIVEHLWNPREGSFAIAASRNAPIQAWALDATGTWSALFLVARGRPEMASRALATVERHFFAEHRQIAGYHPYAGVVADYPDTDWSQQDLHFVEGSMGAALAHVRTDSGLMADRALRAGAQLQCLTGGGLPYATRSHRDFPMAEAVAPTAWYAIAVAARLGVDEEWKVWGPAIRAQSGSESR